MRNETRQKFTALTTRIAILNGVESVDKNFTVNPSVQQTLEAKIQQSSAFLSKINVVPVQDQEGEKLGLGVTGTIAGRTKTSDGTPRKPRNVADMSKGTYRCVKTDFDTAFPYAQMDMWAKFKNFQQLLSNAIIKQQALDRIMIGFNGTSIAANTDRVANPLLQDVNKGWLQKYREEAPERVLKEVKPGTGKIKVGKNVPTEEGYKTLDSLVYDAANSLIDEVFAENPDLVVIVGREMLADKYFPILDDDKATEQVAADLVISQKRIGGLPAVRAPFFPAGKMLITPLSNLSLYYQEGSRRRHMKEEPEYDRAADYQSSNDDYVVEVYAAGCLIENIEVIHE